jgi:GntR family transcriptional regulator
MSRPLHTQVAEAIRARIIGGELPTGAPIPSEAQLCEQFGASRGTIRTALATLRREGLLSGGQGRPPTVRDTALGQPFEQLISFSAWVRQIGHTAGQRTIEVARRGATAAAAEALGIDEGDPVVDVLRLRLLDGHPAMLERSTFVEHVGRLLFDFDPDAGSLYAYLTAAGVDLHGARHTMDAVARRRSRSSGLPTEMSSRSASVSSAATASDGTPLEYADDRYRPDRVTFTIDNTRPSAAGIRTDVRILKEIS